MPNSPVKMAVKDNYRPRAVRTVGQKPACLVNASVTYCGGNNIYAFGGFDAYTDEVYNHVLKLDLASHQWSLVDNYGDIPGVRMGHTATLYQGDKLLIFGGENEHRTYLSDLIIFDLKSAHWTQPLLDGPIPRGRARHAAVLHDDKLFIIGGITGQNNYVLDDIFYLDLKTFTWSRSWRFVPRFDHQAFVWNDRIWVFGGMTEDAEKVGDIYWLDLKGTPAFDSPVPYNKWNRNQQRIGSSRPFDSSPSAAVGSSGYAANSSSAQVLPPSFLLTSPSPIAPGSISSVRFVSGPDIPSQGSGMHFHVYSSGSLLDFVTPAATISQGDCSLSSLDLDTLRWQKLANGREMFRSSHRWHYCTLNETGTKAWLLGCPQGNDGTDGSEESLCDVMEIDLRRYGLLGNDLAASTHAEATKNYSGRSGRGTPQPSKGLGADLAAMFDVPPTAGSGSDFVVTALADDTESDMMSMSQGHLENNLSVTAPGWLSSNAATSQPIHVHKLILQARWPHFARLYNSQMAEFHSKKMHIPEPYTVVKAFLRYLYTDSLSAEDVPDLDDVSGLLVLANLYDLPNLRLVCVNRLSKEIDVEHACIIWHCASTANEEWLRKRAANYCLVHWGRVVRTQGFLKLPREALVELSQEVDMEGRVVGGEELEVVGGLAGGRFGVGGVRKASMSSNIGREVNNALSESEDEDEDMETS